MKLIFLLLILLFSKVLVANVQTEVRQLDVLVQKQELLNQQIRVLELKLKEPQLIGKAKKQIYGEIAKRSKELDQTESYFRYISTGVNAQPEGKVKKRNLLREVENIINPLINAISRISERPRKIEKLRYDLEEVKRNKSELNSGVERLKSYSGKLNSAKIEKKIEALSKEYLQDIATFELTEKQLQIDLDELLDSKESLLSVWSKTLFHFFKTKGINLLLAFMAFGFFWIVLMQLKKRALNSHLLQTQFQWAIRPLNVLYTSLIFIFGIIVSIIVLYIRNDWFLVTIIVIFIIGFAWSIKQWIPQFLNKGKLLLNLGPIREQELVLWKGVPYQIDKLSYFSTLVNPLIMGGRLRISIEELAQLQSRPVLENEIWFASKIGDWVALSDGEYGVIQMQTPEQGVLKSCNGMEIYYKIADYLDLHPINYSKGFLLDVRFNFDISEQERLDNPFFTKLEKNIITSLKEYDIESSYIKIDGLRNGTIDLVARVKVAGTEAKNRNEIEFLTYRSIFDFMQQEKISFPRQSYNIEMKNS